MPFNNLTLALLWTGRGCPESGRLCCSGRYKGVQSLDGTGALAGIRASRLWTLGLLWTVRVLWTLGYSGQVGGVQSLDACVALDGLGGSRVNESLKVKISSTSGSSIKNIQLKKHLKEPVSASSIFGTRTVSHTLTPDNTQY